MFRNEYRRLTRDITSHFRLAGLGRKTTEAAQENTLTVCQVTLDTRHKGLDDGAYRLLVVSCGQSYFSIEFSFSHKYILFSRF